MAAVCFTTVKSRVVRLTRLDECGTPVIGARSSIVSQGFIKVESGWDIEDGETFEQQNAWGDYCTNEQDDPKIKGADVEVEFCEVNPDAYDLVSGARVIAATAAEDFAELGSSIGYVLGEDTVPGAWALETWTKLGGAVCGDTGATLWAYSVWPFLKGGRPGDLTLERGTATFPQSARARGASATWGSGPYGDAIVTLLEGEVFAQVVTDVQPPVPTDCGAVALAAG